MSYFNTSLRALVSVAALSAAIPFSAQALEWNIERNFRYFKHDSDLAPHRVAYDLYVAQNGKAPTVEQLELLMNGGDFWAKQFPNTPAVIDARRKWPFAWRIASTPYQLVQQLRTADQSPLPSAAELDRRGWGSLMVSLKSKTRPEGGTETCWSSILRRHGNCSEYGASYVAPRGWVVRIFDPAAAAVDTCQWTADRGFPAGSHKESEFGAPPTQAFPGAGQVSASCLEFRLFVPAEIGPDGKATGHAKVTRTMSGSPPVSIDVAPRDVLIVGMGDSMTSGEGNPEQPATFDGRNDGVDGGDNGPAPGHFWSTKDTLLPARYGGDARYPENRAQWTDRRCHRSVYSWQTRTALHVALTNPRQSVTLLHYGCSGAEVFEGLLYRYNGVEAGAGNLADGHPASLGLLYQELCKDWRRPTLAEFGRLQPNWQDDKALKRAGFENSLKAPANRKNIVDHLERNVLRCNPVGDTQDMRRTADALLLAIGINDIGFSKWVAGAVADERLRGMVGGFIPDANDRETQMRLKRLAYRYDILKHELDSRVLPALGLAGKGSPPASPLPGALVISYPVSLQGADGKICAHGNQSMTAATFRSGLFGEEAAKQCTSRPFPNATGPIFAMRRPADMTAIEKFANDNLNGGVRDFVKSGALKYTLVETVTPAGPNRFDKRGFCATTDPASAMPAGQKCLNWTDMGVIPPSVVNAPNPRHAAAESLHIARNGPVFAPPGPGLDWRPFAAFPKGSNAFPNYALFYPYASRTRLFRTVNDVYMLINNRALSSSDATGAGVLDLLGRATSGAFHPTAEGHAIVGSLMFEALPPQLRQ